MSESPISVPVFGTLEDEWRGRLREMRAKAGLSLRAVADLLGNGTHFTTIGKIESGKTALTTEWIERLSAVYGVTPADVFHPEFAQSNVQQVKLYCPFEEKEKGKAQRDWLQFGWFPTSYGSASSFAVATGWTEAREFSEIEVIAVIDPEQVRLRFESLYLLELANHQYYIGRHLKMTDVFEGIKPFSDQHVTIGRDPFRTLGRVVLLAHGYSY